MITALCVSPNSVYKQLGVECYDYKRNARTFIGKNPVIAHPPCRGYSAHMAHFAKPAPGEKDLALFCTEQIARNGGVLEHPAHSRFVRLFEGNPQWKICKLNQSWFGYPTKKKTWLLMPAHYSVPEFPFVLESYGKDKQIFEHMSAKRRSHTTVQFATWLITLVLSNA